MTYMHITIASADRGFRARLRSAFIHQGNIDLNEAWDYVQLLRLVEASKSTIVLMDAQLKSVASDSLLPCLHAVSPDTRILLFYDDVSDKTVIDAITQGAQGCLLKSAPVEEWYQAIKVVLSGDVWIKRRMLFQALTEALLQSDQKPHPLADKLACLTERQREVVAYAERGLSNKEIARQLDISPTTVKTHLQNVFGKLGIPNRLLLMMSRAP